MAVPAIAIGIAGTADAADAPSTTVGAAAQAHLSTLVPAVTVDEHGVHPDTVEPTPFHQFHLFNQSPFHQGVFHQQPGGGFGQLSQP